jgi:hypothetical protein
MKYVIRGNDKLGKNCVVVSRAVGDSCPDSCVFHPENDHPQKCYAGPSGTEGRFPNARNAGLANMVTDKNRIRAMILHAVKLKRPIRIHERGDFGENNKVDHTYIDNWMWAIDSVIRDGIDPTDIWVYTHFYDSRLVALGFRGVHVYASVHSARDLKKAKKAGFTLFAYISKIKKKDGSPNWVEVNGMGRTLVCPEQRKGRKFVTCTGGNGTTKCDWCVKGKGNVVFLEH